MTDPIHELAQALGIVARYTDQMGGTRDTSRETALALLAAMGAPVTSEAEATDRLRHWTAAETARSLPRWIVARTDAPIHLGRDPGTWVIQVETGSEIEGTGPDLPPLPLGIHVLHAGHEEMTILSAPDRLPSPPRGWGMTAPLWGLCPPETPGFGDYVDLARTGKAMAAAGASFLGINPIHAGFATEPGWTSPYTPSHRRRLNPMHIATGPGAAQGPFVDYSAEIPAKRAALAAAFARFQGDGAFDAFCRSEGDDLRIFAAHQALSARYGALWTDWPAHLHDPRAALSYVTDPEIGYHQWLQWMAHRQLGAAQSAMTEAGMRYGLYLDLAVGTHPAGAETWAERGVFAQGVSLGAPPDAMTADGQRWGLAPFNPQALEQTHFRALAETIRRPLAHARLLRIDHILGFDRAFWVPEAPGLAGAYVQMPRAAMLAVIRIEAARAGATIIGEDLGNIPDGLQEALAVSGILGCRLMQFEGARPPEEYPALCLASFGTHDLPTMAGWPSGRDIAARLAIGQIGPEIATREHHQRQHQATALGHAAGGESAPALHGYLARTTAQLVAVQAEDVLELPDQANLPGTVDQYPNWKQKLPVAGPDLAQDRRMSDLAELMREAGR
jgi:4-alpha-glucanotransferase